MLHFNFSRQPTFNITNCATVMLPPVPLTFLQSQRSALSHSRAAALFARHAFPANAATQFAYGPPSRYQTWGGCLPSANLLKLHTICNIAIDNQPKVSAAYHIDIASIVHTARPSGKRHPPNRLATGNHRALTPALLA